jgi:DMSO/TMAO reductase YedYZ molybdopterin-dependent catalytic subunit
LVILELHWIPAATAAVLIILFSFVKDKHKHRYLSYAMVFFAVLGLAGYILDGGVNLFSLNFHALHAWLGIAALLLSIGVFVEAVFFKKGLSLHHCNLGRIAAALSFAALLIGVLLLTGLISVEPGGLPTAQVPTSSTLPEVEAKEFQGFELTPLSAQGNNAINGTQYINRTTYRLFVTGLVEHEMEFSYDDLLRLPAYAEVAYMPCVGGWGFTAKWTGFRLIDLLNVVGLKPNATYVVFYCYDGYATGLPLNYLKTNQTLMAYGINDVTLPPERGFPFQLVAVNKYGYKWAKWITSIAVGDKVVEGYWESRGYSNNADVGSFPYG